MSFVLAGNPVVILIKELKLAINDNVFNNSYKRAGTSCVVLVGQGFRRDFGRDSDSVSTSLEPSQSLLRHE